MMESTKQVKRPLWLVILALFLGVVGVSGIIALAGHYLMYLTPVYPLLMGLAGGIFGWLLADRWGLLKKSNLFLFGTGFGVLIYLNYHYFAWLLFNINGAVLPLADYVALLLEQGITISRRSTVFFSMNGPLMWLYWAAEVMITIASAAYIAYLCHKHNFIKTTP